MLFQIILSIVAVSLYIVETYQPASETSPLWITVLEWIFTSFFLIDYLLFFYFARDRLRHFFSLAAIIDLVTILPVFAAALLPAFSRSVPTQTLRILRILRALRIVRATRILQFSEQGVQRQLFVLLLTTISILVLVSAIIIQVEKMQFHTALYFSIVTFTTVGYGEITPQTEEGRVLMMILIALGFFALSWQTGRLVNLIGQASKYAGRIRPQPHSKHVIVCGNMSFDSLQHFLMEFYAGQAEHLQAKTEYRVVIMNSDDPPPAIKGLLNHPLFRAQWLTGSELVENDLKRVSAQTAAAAFVLSERHGDSKDAKTVMRCLALRSFAPDLPLFVQCVHPETKEHLRRIGGVMNFACSDELSTGILGQSVIAPGFSTLITNLCRTYSVDYELSTPWRNEYYAGCAQQLYGCGFPPAAIGKPFASVSAWAYRNFHLTLIAVEGDIPHASGQRSGVIRIVANPKKYLIRNEDRGFVIATDLHCLQEFEEYEGDINLEDSDGIELQTVHKHTSQYDLGSYLTRQHDLDPDSCSDLDLEFSSSSSSLSSSSEESDLSSSSDIEVKKAAVPPLKVPLRALRPGLRPTTIENSPSQIIRPGMDSPDLPGDEPSPSDVTVNIDTLESRQERSHETFDFSELESDTSDSCQPLHHTLGHTHMTPRGVATASLAASNLEHKKNVADSLGVPWWLRPKAFGDLVKGENQNVEWDEADENRVTNDGLREEFQLEEHATDDPISHLGNVPRTSYDDMILDMVHGAAQHGDRFELHKTRYAQQWLSLCHVNLKPKPLQDALLSSVPFSGHILVKVRKLLYLCVLWGGFPC
jgi:voltage-gated potassium channel Kch